MYFANCIRHKKSGRVFNSYFLETGWLFKKYIYEGVTSAGEGRLTYWRQHDRSCRVDQLVVMTHRGVVVNSDEAEY